MSMLSLADRVAVLEAGRIVQEGARADVRADPAGSVDEKHASHRVAAPWYGVHVEKMTTCDAMKHVQHSPKYTLPRSPSFSTVNTDWESHN